jgi:predicted DNA-binding antitoxin AbrB/MazE fold protein
MSRKPKSRRINVDARDRWKQILKTVSKDEVPVSLLEKVHVNLIDGTKVEVDIAQLLSEGMHPDDIKDELNSRLKKMDEIIKDVDFFISVENVAKTVQPVTDEILKTLT